MKGNLFKAFQLMAVVSEWSIRALDDGKVTMNEAAELAANVCAVLGVKAELDVPGISDSK